MAEKKRKSKKGTEVKKGDKFSCRVCGIVLTVDEPCSCVETCDLICCGKQMEPEK